jgi:membrane protein DedA with SNARE-associated domain
MASDSSDLTRWMRLRVPGRRVGLAIAGTALFALVVVALLDAGLVSIPEGTTEMARGLLQEYGLAALFAVFVIEGVMLLYFAPSESLVPGALLVFGSSPATIAAILAVAVVAATVGQVALFVLARRLGRGWILRHRLSFVSESQLERFDRWFDRWGPLAVPASNTMLFTRGMLTVPAGLSEMRLRRFALLSALGTLSFESILAGATLVFLGVI